jgi:hypothetical protein
MDHESAYANGRLLGCIRTGDVPHYCTSHFFEKKIQFMLQNDPS